MKMGTSKTPVKADALVHYSDPLSEFGTMKYEENRVKAAIVFHPNQDRLSLYVLTNHVAIATIIRTTAKTNLSLGVPSHSGRIAADHPSPPFLS